LNRHLPTLVVTPRESRALFRRHRQVVLDQIRTVDRGRLVKRLGRLTAVQPTSVLEILAAMFAE
jgi:mRNA interferase MazF